MRHNGGMHMSAELVTLVLVGVGFVIIYGGIIFAGLAWFLRRMGDRFDKLDQRFDELDCELRTFSAE